MDRRRPFRSKSGAPSAAASRESGRAGPGDGVAVRATPSLLESAWSGLEARRDFLAHATELLAEINERCLEGLTHSQPGSRAEFDLVRELRSPLQSLTPDMRHRISRVPFLLIDIQFCNEDWWRSVTASPARRFQSPAWKGTFSPRMAASIGRASLAFARQSLRVDAPATMALCGLSSAVAAIITSVKLTQLERVAEHHYSCVRPRWEDRPAVWRRLIACATAEERHRLREFCLHALQLQAGEVAPLNLSVREHSGID
jgi:hypothetical protein